MIKKIIMWFHLVFLSTFLQAQLEPYVGAGVFSGSLSFDGPSLAPSGSRNIRAIDIPIVGVTYIFNREESFPVLFSAGIGKRIAGYEKSYEIDNDINQLNNTFTFFVVDLRVAVPYTITLNKMKPITLRGGFQLGKILIGDKTVELNYSDPSTEQTKTITAIKGEDLPSGLDCSLVVGAGVFATDKVSINLDYVHGITKNKINIQSESPTASSADLIHMKFKSIYATLGYRF